ncbi:MAG: spore coat protein CotJB [Agathobacter sp.]
MLLSQEQRKLMRCIQEYDLVLTDTVLYLDTHPNDKKALDYYHLMVEKYHQAVCDYTNMYGPISSYQVKNEEHWTWTDCPWPWQMEG